MADVEETLRRLWSSALNGAAEGDDNDDFFAAGGDSLAATELVVGLEQQLSVDVDPGWLYAHPRFADALAALELLASGARRNERTQVGPHVGGRDHPMSAQQQGLIAVLDWIGGAHRYQVAYAAALPGSVDVGLLRDAVSCLGVRHTSLRTTIRGLRQVIHGEAPALEHVRAGASWLDEARAWASAPIAVDDRYLTRFALVTGGAENLLVMAAHQMVTDPWSWGILLRDLVANLATSEPGDGSSLQYSDYARWQQEQLTEAEYERHLAFWRRQCAGFPATGMPLPGAAEQYPGAGSATSLPLRVPAPVVRALRQAAHGLQVSLFHLLLAVFQLAVARWSGSRDVLVGTATANRHVPGTRDIVGYFVNGRFTRTNVPRRATVADAAIRVRDAWTEADAHRELHLEPALFALAVPDLVNVKFSVNAIPALRQLPCLDGRALRAVPVATIKSARRPVSLALAPDGDAFAGALTYRTDVLPACSATALIGAFDELVRRSAAEADRQLAI